MNPLVRITEFQRQFRLKSRYQIHNWIQNGYLHATKQFDPAIGRKVTYLYPNQKPPQKVGHRLQKVLCWILLCMFFSLPAWCMDSAQKPKPTSIAALHIKYYTKAAINITTTTFNTAWFVARKSLNLIGVLLVSI